MVGAGVLHDQRLPGQQGVAAEGDVAWGLGGREALAGLEPLAVCIDQADQRHRDAELLLGLAHDAVEALLGWCVEDPQRAQCGEALRFVG